MTAPVWGAHAASRAGFGVLAETIFLQRCPMAPKEEERVRDGGDAIASTRAACAPQISAGAQVNLTT
jgi:hypothetical protein